MSAKPKAAKKGRNGFILAVITPIIIMLMGSLTFGLALIYGKELRETLTKNQIDLKEMNEQKRKQRLLNVKN
jgi:hypothetical protein